MGIRRSPRATHTMRPATRLLQQAVHAPQGASAAASSSTPAAAFTFERISRRSAPRRKTSTRAGGQLAQARRSLGCTPVLLLVLSLLPLLPPSRALVQRTLPNARRLLLLWSCTAVQSSARRSCGHALGLSTAAPSQQQQRHQRQRALLRRRSCRKTS